MLQHSYRNAHTLVLTTFAGLATTVCDIPLAQHSSLYQRHTDERVRVVMHWQMHAISGCIGRQRTAGLCNFRNLWQIRCRESDDRILEARVAELEGLYIFVAPEVFEMKFYISYGTIRWFAYVNSDSDMHMLWISNIYGV